MEKMRGGLGLDAASNGSSSPCQGRVTLTHALSSSKAGKTLQIQIQSLPHFTIQQCLQILAGELNRQI